MKSVSRYLSLHDFASALDKNPKLRVPFKIMGSERKAKKKRRGSYHSLTMLTYVYSEVLDPDDPKTPSPFDAPFGEIYDYGCILNPREDTYCAETLANAQGFNLFQGDIVEFDFANGDTSAPSCRYSMILSHSCDISHAPFVQICPVYMESELKDGTVEYLRGKSGNSEMIINNWLQNENKEYVGLPAVTISNQAQRLLACLKLTKAVKQTDLPQLPAYRLKYRAMTYLQGRLALLYLRDVYDSDETREV